MGLKIKVDGVEQKTNETPTPEHTGGVKHNSDFDRTMDPETTKMLWSVINENTQLQQKLYMVESKLEQIKRLLAE